MTPEKRWAGLFASIAFLVVATGGMYATLNPIQSALYGLASAFVVGYIGFKMGYIVSHPQNKGKNKGRNNMAMSRNAGADPMTLTPLTGEESFLDDLN